MKWSLSHITLVFVLPIGAWAQNANLNVYLGNRIYETGNFGAAEKLYLDALTTDVNNNQAQFNLGNSYFRQDKKDEAEKVFRKMAYNEELTDTLRAKAFHNLGNIFLTQKEPKIEEAIEAYKSSLRLNPKDNETRYNLAVAQKLLDAQPPQEQQQNQDQQNQDQQNQDQQNQDQQDQENQDQQNQENKSDKEKENQDQENSDKSEGDKNKDEQKDEPQNGEGQEPKMSKEDAERLLEMMENEEEQVQDKLKKKKVKVKQNSIEKDW
ncbi:tetratricopeptide repeat protein [bacterium SCSIO 12741]|nr:tetratricopeptide repeat protein [bacterium SCSIO 12741]